MKEKLGWYQVCRLLGLSRRQSAFVAAFGYGPELVAMLTAEAKRLDQHHQHLDQSLWLSPEYIQNQQERAWMQ